MPKGRGRGRGKNRQQQLTTDDQGRHLQTSGGQRQTHLPVGLSSPLYADSGPIGHPSTSVRPKSTIKVSGQFEDNSNKPERSYRKGTGHEQYEASSSRSVPTSVCQHDVKRHTEATSVQIRARRERIATPSLESCSIGSLSSPPSAEIEQLSLSKQKYEKARKPGYGTSQRKQIVIVTNFFRISSHNNNIYHYDIEISRLGGRMDERVYSDDSKPIGTELGRRIIFELLRLHNHLEDFTPVYDGKKNLFTASPLPIRDYEEFNVPLSFNNKQQMFCVAIKAVQKKKTKNNIISPRLLEGYKEGKSSTFPEEIRLVYDTILSHRAQDSPEIRYGSSFFNFNQRPVSTVGNGLELRQGYNQNIRFTEIGTAVVINIATAVFHKSGPLLDYAADILRLRINNRTTLSEQNISKLTSVLKGVRIQVNHDSYKRKYYIDKVTSILPRNHKFMAKFGNREEEINVETYLHRVYQCSLNYRELPLLLMRKGVVFLPFEVCSVVPGQRIPRKELDKSPFVTRSIIRSTAIPPVEKFKQIQQYVQCASEASSSIMEPYGLSFDTSLEPVTFPTRVLKQPGIEYSPSDVVMPDERGVWELRRNFLLPAEIKKWMIISFSQCDRSVLDKLANLLCTAGNRVGLRLQYPLIEVCRQKTEDILAQAQKRDMQFVVVVLSKFDTSHSYHEVKFISDIRYNLVSQCVHENVITGDRFDDKVASNLCLKINTKLQGINHTLAEWPLALEKESVLVIGADVVHSVNLVCASIAAVVGCVDYTMSKYAVSCRALSNPYQNGKNQEIILTLKEMVQTILMEYWKTTRKKPEKILFYRDGISEGQFQIALDTEIPLIKQACQNMQKDNYQPPITYVVVQKRIAVRFKPQRQNDGIGRMKNVPAGTIVDRGIVDPVNYDFYLVSHEGIQGTSRPVYYTVLFDENRVKPDVIQKLTFYLCFVYARCNRSISIPAPVKYADLLAYRALHYVDAYTEQPKRGRRFYRQEDRIPEDIINLIKSVEHVQNRMFFI